MALSILFVDTETTGVASNCAIHELAFIFTIDGKVIDRQVYHMAPDEEAEINRKAIDMIPWEDDVDIFRGEELYNKKLQKILNYPSPNEVYGEIMKNFQTYRNQAGGKLLFAGYNAKFDWDKMIRFVKINGQFWDFLKIFHSSPVDVTGLVLTALSARGDLSNLKKTKQSVIAEYLAEEIKIEELEGQFHTAIFDVEVCRRLYFWSLKPIKQMAEKIWRIK